MICDLRRYGDSATQYVAWRRRRARALSQGFADFDVPVAISESVATMQRSAKDAIFIGVTTGVLVWTITHMLDRFFGGAK